MSACPGAPQNHPIATNCTPARSRGRHQYLIGWTLTEPCLGSRKAVVDIGSVAQPFSIFIPDIKVPKGQALLSMLLQRYLSEGTEGGRTVTRPRRSYGYVKGQLKVFNGRPEIMADGPEDVSDVPF